MAAFSTSKSKPPSPSPPPPSGKGVSKDSLPQQVSPIDTSAKSRDTGLIQAQGPCEAAPGPTPRRNKQNIENEDLQYYNILQFFESASCPFELPLGLGFAAFLKAKPQFGHWQTEQRAQRRVASHAAMADTKPQSPFFRSGRLYFMGKQTLAHSSVQGSNLQAEIAALWRDLTGPCQAAAASEMARLRSLPKITELCITMHHTDRAGLILHHYMWTLSCDTPAFLIGEDSAL